ncbi:hypothetical protein PoB_000622000 [Plakobranchus ocellatus]|uniref:Uncharacterized protein n=1 Tax=Plakobranchus ocellatus TaxID=259542 RepID=A0AAV3Y9C9_9GAST|nr:hypothetical protein PoB_000622000 [Plakobranchus ocellatus]
MFVANGGFAHGILQVGKGNGGSSGRAVAYQVGDPRFESQSRPSKFFIAPCVYPARNGLLIPSDSKRGEESNGKLPYIMPYAKNNQDPAPGSPMLGLSVGPTMLQLLATM